MLARIIKIMTLSSAKAGLSVYEKNGTPQLRCKPAVCVASTLVHLHVTLEELGGPEELAQIVLAVP